jgi:hypothetical protein
MEGGAAKKSSNFFASLFYVSYLDVVAKNIDPWPIKKLQGNFISTRLISEE